MFNYTEKFRFGEFTLTPAKRTLFRERTEIKLRDKDFDVLSFLIESVPNTCSHDEIIESVWDGTSVENGSVEKAIANIRKSLSDDARNPRFIKTVRSKGYLFIGDVKEVEPKKDKLEDDSYLSETSIPKLDSQTSDKKPEQIKEKQKFRYILFCIAVLVVFAAMGIYLAKTFVFNSQTESNVLFSDDFSEKELDLQKWKAKGKSIKVLDGNAIITIDETDKGGNLWTSYFSFDPTKPIIISSRLKINPSKTFNKYYFQGEFLLIPKVFPKEPAGAIDYDWVKRTNLAFGLFYNKHEYESEEQIPIEGFFLIKPGGRPAEKYSHKAGTISKSIEPIWNGWFKQKIIYNPTTGLMEYFIDSEKKGEINVGNLPPLDENKLQLQITPYGWYTNHSMEIDYIYVTQ